MLLNWIGPVSAALAVIATVGSLVAASQSRIDSLRVRERIIQAAEAERAEARKSLGDALESYRQVMESWHEDDGNPVSPQEASDVQQLLVDVRERERKELRSETEKIYEGLRDEAYGEQSAQDRKYTWLQRSAHALRFAQIILGGAITSSFVQQSISKQWIGFLGLLVLLSTLVDEAYKPSQKASIARYKSSRLKTILRRLDGQYAKIRDEDPTAPTIESLVNSLTIALEEVDNVEEAPLTQKGGRSNA